EFRRVLFRSRLVVCLVAVVVRVGSGGAAARLRPPRRGRTPDQARAADHPRRAARPPRRLQPARLRPAPPHPHRTQPRRTPRLTPEGKPALSNHTDPTGRTSPIVPGDLFARHQTITGLRALADFLEANPGVPVNTYGETFHVPIRAADDASAVALVDQTAALLGVNAQHDTRRG